MTDLNERFAAMLEGEPEAPYDLEHVVRSGRRALRRRNSLVAVAGTAGTAAVTAAVVVPIAASTHSGSPTTVTVLSSPAPTPPPACKAYYIKVTRAEHKLRHPSLWLMKQYEKHQSAAGDTVKSFKLNAGGAKIVSCPPGAVVQNGQPDKTPQPSTSLPPYTYSADPQTIANGFADELAKQVHGLGFTIIYSRPFAQESSTLEPGHPTYYDGNVDVQLPNGPADIGVQVTHATTSLAAADKDCDPADCTETKLPDGSVEQISHIHSGSDGAEVIAVQIERSDGLIVEAQESNYGFGPEATKARSSQPLTIDQLTALAEDPAFAF